MSHPDITLEAIVAAQRTLKPFLTPSLLLESHWLSSIAGASVFLKLESLLPTNAFKIRGALYAVSRMAGQRNATVVTASAGNHGRAMALAGGRFGVRTVVFTPRSAPATKKKAIVRHGAELHDDLADYDAAEQAARAYASREGATFISPYNHPDVIAGAGTVGLEILDQITDLDSVVVPIGGGGLASGVALALKRAAPQVKVIGVEVDASRPFAVSVARGAIAKVDVQPSLADGLTGNLEPGSITFEYVRAYVDTLVSVSEDALRTAIRGLVEEEHLIAEGAGAAATAAVLSRDVVAAGERAVVLVTGANIDLADLQKALATVAAR
jgi:threonine dehydratase